MKKLQNKKKGVPCLCKKDCADRCDGCRVKCKKYKVYEKLKRYEAKKRKNELIHKELQSKEYNAYDSRKEMYAEWAIQSRRNRKNMFGNA